MKRAAPAAGKDFLFGTTGVGESTVSRDGEKGIELRIDLGDAVEEGACELEGRKFFAAEKSGEGLDGEEKEI